MAAPSGACLYWLADPATDGEPAALEATFWAARTMRLAARPARIGPGRPVSLAG
jgi:hypothetical protein